MLGWPCILQLLPQINKLSCYEKRTQEILPLVNFKGERMVTHLYYYYVTSKEYDTIAEAVMRSAIKLFIHLNDCR